jgi:DNA-binding transcriptional ArsR family regulator
MPLTSGTETPLRIRFDCSVAAELLFLLSAIESGAGDDGAEPLRVAGMPVPPELADRVARQWPEPVLFWELFVIADAAGGLGGPVAASEIEEAWDAACDTMTLDPPLRSEPELDGETIRARLAALHADRSARRQYLQLMADVWEIFEQDWTVRRLPVIERSIEECRAREARGSAWQTVLKGSETASEALEAGWQRARDGGAAVVAVCAYGGSLVIDLPSTEFFAMSIKGRHPVDRERAADAARRLRSMSDPTRLALLQLLGERPRTVGELAVDLDVAQPTVSNHIKVLREAGVVQQSDSEHDRRALTVDLEAVAALFDDVRKLLGAPR